MATPRFIAEIGSNHNRDENRCLTLIDQAAAAGCGAVKLQVFRVDDLFAPVALERDPALRARRAWEFPLELLPVVRQRCTERGVQLGATPFSLWAVDELQAFVDFFKIASYELLWHDLLRAAAATGKPVVLSTGMATETEIGAALAATGDADTTLLHCVSGYPTPSQQSNLAAIETLRQRFECPVGWSDHTGAAEVVVRAAVRWSASDIEVHIDLDGEGNEAGPHNWTSRSIAEVIDTIARSPGGGEGTVDPELARAIDGDGIKRPMPVELPDVPWRADPKVWRRRPLSAPACENRGPLEWYFPGALLG
jgi:sialic acid synthase SpsE